MGSVLEGYGLSSRQQQLSLLSKRVNMMREEHEVRAALELPFETWKKNEKDEKKAWKRDEKLFGSCEALSKPRLQEAKSRPLPCLGS